jgi:heat shock protein HtpX
MTNQLKTGILLGLLTGLILLFGNLLGGQGGLMIAFILALVMNVGSYWYSDRIVLSMYKAQEVSANQAPELHGIVQELAAKAGLPKPRVFIMPGDAPNAFATGRNPDHGVVAVTQGLLKLLSQEEIKGVLAHEMGHIKNRDILIQTVAATLAGVIMFVSSMVKWAAIFGIGGDDEGGGNPLLAIVLAIVAPIAAMLIQMAISRSREYLADQSGAELAGNPRYLASALEKLEAYSKKAAPKTQASPATAHMFIVNPLSGSSMANLFSTHPPIQERIKRLQGMGA